MNFIFNYHPILLLLEVQKLTHTEYHCLRWCEGKGHETKPAVLLQPHFITTVTACIQAIAAAVWIILVPIVQTGIKQPQFISQHKFNWYLN